MDIDALIKDGTLLVAFFVLIGSGFVIYLVYLWYQEVGQVKKAEQGNGEEGKIPKRSYLHTRRTHR